MRRLRNVVSGVLVTVLLGALATAAAGPAAADDALPITRLSGILADPRTGNVYLSSSTDNVVVVVDAGGNLRTVLRDLDGASGMLVRDDVLYVSLWKDQSIAAIDTTTLTERTRYPTGAGTCPWSLATTGTVLWFSYGCNSAWGRGIGAVRFTAGGATVALGQQGPVTFLEKPEIAAAPNGTMLVGEPGTARAHVFEVTATGLRLRTSVSYDAAGSGVNQIAVTPDGTRALIASGSPYHVQESSTVDFALTGRYDTGTSPSSVVLTRDGRYVAAGMDSSSDVDVAVFRAGSPAPVTTVDFGTAGGWQEPNRTARRGLAWSGDGERLYAVTVNTYDERPTLRVLYPLG